MDSVKQEFKQTLCIKRASRLNFDQSDLDLIGMYRWRPLEKLLIAVGVRPELYDRIFKEGKNLEQDSPRHQASSNYRWRTCAGIIVTVLLSLY